ncbi:hypothetical protein C1646_791777, partial [Rhizophagus diaphanus]
MKITFKYEYLTTKWFVHLSNITKCSIKYLNCKFMNHEASSQIKSLARIINLATLLFHEILHVEDSFNLSRILNRLCAVLPHIIKRAVMPDDATAIAISPDDLTVASKVLYKNVLPVPPGPSIKKHSFSSAITCRTALYIA